MTEHACFLLLASLRGNRGGTGGGRNRTSAITTVLRCALWVLLKVQAPVGTSVQQTVVLTKVRGRNTVDTLNQQLVVVVVGRVQGRLERCRNIPSIVDRFYFVGRDDSSGGDGGGICE